MNTQWDYTNIDNNREQKDGNSILSIPEVYCSDLILSTIVDYHMVISHLLIKGTLSTKSCISLNLSNWTFDEWKNCDREQYIVHLHAMHRLYIMLDFFV